MPLAEIGAVIAAGSGELGKQAGPFRLWQWGVIGIGSFAVYRYAQGALQSKAGAAQSAGPGAVGTPISYDQNSLAGLAQLQTEVGRISDTIAGMQTNQQPIGGTAGAPGVKPIYDLAILSFNLTQAANLPQFAHAQGLLYEWASHVDAMLTGGAPIDNALLAAMGNFLSSGGISVDKLLIIPPVTSGTTTGTGTGTTTGAGSTSNGSNFLGTPLLPGQSIVNGQLVGGTQLNTANPTNNNGVTPILGSTANTGIPGGEVHSTGSVIHNADGTDSVIVGQGQSLATLAALYLGDANLWPMLFGQNQGIIGQNPNNVYPGMIIQLPPKSAYGQGAGQAVSSTVTVVRQ